MYKQVGNSQHFIARTGSHTTKGSRSGRVTVLPPEARPHEQAHLELREQLRVLDEERNKLCIRRDALQVQVASARPDKKSFLLHELKKLHYEFKKLKVKRNKIRKTMKYAQLMPWCIVFYYIAKERLDAALFQELEKETRQLTGRSLEHFALNWFRPDSVDRIKP